MTTVQILTKSVYGRSIIYPANANAEMLVSLTGRKTFEPWHVGVIIDLGHTVEQTFGNTSTPINAVADIIPA